MASGSSSRANNPGSKAFDFASDDILCSYDDFANQDNTNGNHSDPVTASNSAKEFHKNRMTRTAMFPAPAYSPPEESSVHQDVGAIVEKTVKKYADNLMRFLEGISSRLSQLELYCYNLDKSIGEMHSDLVRDHGEADTKLKSLEKNLQEVHRSVQILRDKQELVEAQKELAKLQLAQKDSSGSNSQENEERTKQPPDTKRGDNEVHEQQLALALPHQLTPQASHTTRPVEQQQQQQQPVQAPAPIPSQGVAQSPGYYLPQPQMPQAPNQLSQSQYMPSDSQYRTSQAQDFSRLPPQPVQSQLNQTPQTQGVPPYQQQWVPQLPQQVLQPQPQQQPQPQPQPPSMQQQARPSSPAVYPSYLPSQSNPTPEMVPSTVSMQVPFSGISQTVASRPEGMPYGYGGHGRPVQPQAPAQHLRPTFGAAGDGYGVGGSHPSLAPGNAYVMYDGEGARTHPTQQPHFSHGGYPPSSFPMQNPQPAANTSVMTRPPQMVRNHPYNELIEKLVSMGYRGDHVIAVIQRLEESGQTVDFNAILDRLNGHSSGGSQRGW
ncbi:PREDICTED: ataxin-2 homolog isoform X2 [Ipomoea nil]|uniref:ataxin-2 homolog isoform X2 n=1 Tax=Ipomoea nil TaxID=35883 RepID=UPI000900D9DA|nr:PREDICTED: ataxin-2 homolog isoform X2 [Ipomoea nil]